VSVVKDKEGALFEGEETVLFIVTGNRLRKHFQRREGGGTCQGGK